MTSPSVELLQPWDSVSIAGIVWQVCQFYRQDKNFTFLIRYEVEWSSELTLQLSEDVFLGWCLNLCNARRFERFFKLWCEIPQCKNIWIWQKIISNVHEELFKCLLPIFLILWRFLEVFINCRCGFSLFLCVQSRGSSMLMSFCCNKVLIQFPSSYFPDFGIRSQLQTLCETFSCTFSWQVFIWTVTEDRHFSYPLEVLEASLEDFLILVSLPLTSPPGFWTPLFVMSSKKLFHSKYTATFSAILDLWYFTFPKAPS